MRIRLTDRVAMIRLRQGLLILFFLLIGPYRAVSGEIDYPGKDLFPLPEELEPQVQFWIDIYTRYYTNQYILHDAENINVIFEVVKIGELREDQIDLPQTRTQRNYLKNKKRYYQRILRKLGSSRTHFDRLVGDEKRVFELYGGIRSHKFYRKAARRVRIQRGQRDRFLRGLRLSGRYMPYIKRILAQEGLPEQLAVLPHVESSFEYRAYSAAGAAGIWQFTRHTGRLFLKIDYEIDERLDPILATEAAARLLKKNFEELGSWPLAITAYNHGLHGMKRAQRRLHTSDIAKIVKKYRSRTFGFASKNFYCEFLAALHITTHYRDYFGEVQFEPPIRFQEFELPYYVKLSTLSRYLGIDVDRLREFNPALRNPIFAGTKYIPKGYRLRLPPNLDAFQLFAQIPPSELYLAQKRSRWYRVRRGDTLSRIARRFRTSIHELMALNDLRNMHRIRAGMVLRLPPQRQLTALSSAPAPAKQETRLALNTEITKTAPGGAEIVRTPVTEKPRKPQVPPRREVEKRIAQKSEEPAIPAARKARRRALPPDAGIPVDLEVELIPGTNPPEGYIRIEPEETLGHYADWLKVPTQRIRDWNGLAFGQSLRLGEKIKLVFAKVSPEDFSTARLEYHRSLEEDFFSNYRVLGTITHKVKRGENIWYLCNQVYNLPLWLIQSYNSDLDLNRLRPGDLILIPEIASVSSNADSD